MNSDELLNSLNSQNHEKHKNMNMKKMRPGSVEEEQKMDINCENEFEEIRLSLPVPEAPAFLTNYLKELYDDGLVSGAMGEKIARARMQKEKNAYLAYNNGPLAYLTELKNLMSEKNKFEAKVPQAVSDFMGKINSNVSSELENGKMHINMDRAIITKEQMEGLSRFDVARLIKIKDGAIRSKLDLMNERLENMEKLEETLGKGRGRGSRDNDEEINRRLQENMDRINYGPKSEKTKMARDYVRHLKDERSEMRKREDLRQERARRVEQERRKELLEAEQVKDHVKKEEVLRQIEVKKKKREEEEKQLNDREAEVQSFLALYRQREPVHEKKQRQYEDKFVKQEKAYHEQCLKEIKEKKKSYSLNDIADHQKKYEVFKEKQMLRKSQEKEMLDNEKKGPARNYYRSSAHSYAEEGNRQSKLRNMSLLQESKKRKERMLDYSKVVDEAHKPKVDHRKREEILSVLENERIKKGKLRKKYRQALDSDGMEVGMQSYYEEIKPVNRYKEGNRFLEIAKRRKKNGSLSMAIPDEHSRQEQEQRSHSLARSFKKSSQELKEEKAETEREVWSLRARNMEQMSNNLASNKEFQQVKINFENFDKRAANKESLLKNSGMSVEDHIVHKGALDLFYIESIKQKMRLLG